MTVGTSLEAIEQVYRGRSRDFFRFALAVVGDADLAHEAVQEGFVRAIRARSTFRGRGQLEAWVARCVVNAARDALRRRRALPEERLSSADLGPEMGLPDHDLRALVRELPARQREVLFLRFYLDLDYASIGKALGIEVGTVSASLHAAREHLGRTLEEVTT